MRLYKPTEIFPATVSQEIRAISPKDDDAPEGSVRLVQILTPDKPTIMVAVTPDPRFVDDEGNIVEDLADAAGLNRTYKFATLSPGGYTPVHLLPGQTLWAAAENGLGMVSLIIEYREGH